MLVISDTSPICYLLLIGQLDLLPHIYGRVVIPKAVQNELADPRSPEVVQQWIQNPPQWLEIQSIEIQADAVLENLGLGEQQAILLAEQRGGDLLLLDDQEARQVAQSKNLRITGTLGVLVDGAALNLLSLPEAIARLRQTSFRVSPKLLENILGKV